MPGAARPRPPFNPAPSSQSPEARTPRAPTAGNEVGSREGSEPGALRTRLSSREAAAAAPGIKLVPARPSRRCLGDRYREGGAAGPGWHAGQPAGAAAGDEREVLPSSRHARPRPAGRWDRRAGGGAAIPRRRGWGAGGGESEARPAS